MGWVGVSLGWSIIPRGWVGYVCLIQLISHPKEVGEGPPGGGWVGFLPGWSITPRVRRPSARHVAGRLSS